MECNWEVRGGPRGLENNLKTTVLVQVTNREVKATSGGRGQEQIGGRIYRICEQDKEKRVMDNIQVFNHSDLNG